ncbi:MAG TPA: FmdB family zinc ribbon protein [Blastocatellia bacterium]|nr:FmdB family zinc ribbon protein [Blastocatellia bacterium]
MPIFKYVCKECDHGFEKFVQASTVPECPSCKSKALEKQLSVFNPGKGQSMLEQRAAVGPCGTCGDPRGPGSCSIN